MQPFTLLRPEPADYALRRDSIPTGTVRPVRTNITRACNGCRTKKIKCDGQKPTCSNCAILETECVYDLDKDKRRKEGWKTLVSDLQRRNRELEETLSLLKCNSSADTMERVQLLRGGQQFPSFADGEGASGSSASASHHGSSKHGSEESQSQGSSRLTRPPLVNWGSCETLRSRSDMSLFSIDDASAINASVLPPEEVTRQATSSFFPCAAAYFYIMSPDACGDLTSRVYDQSTVSSKSDFCQICAIAATGAKYCTDGIPDSTCRVYFQLATLLLQDTVEENPLAAMRVCVCLSVYLVLDKLASARVILATGFSIARSGMPKSIGSDSDADGVEWTRVFRTIAFTECLLASTLGYTADLRPEEISLLESLAATESAMNPLFTLNRRLLSWQIFKITHISAQIDVRLRYPARLSEHELRLLSTKLDSWLKELPQSLSLAAACQDTSIPNMMPILLMHMVNITTRVTFYERVIRLSLNTSDESVLHQVLGLPGDICDIYAGFAQQLTRIVGLFNEHHCVIKNCWITIHSCYHAALGLLLRALQHLSLGHACDRAQENLSSAHICVETLGTCSEKDLAAMQLLNRIAPSYHRLKRVADNLALTEEEGPIGQSEMTAADRSEVDDVASELVAWIAMHVEES